MSDTPNLHPGVATLLEALLHADVDLVSTLPDTWLINLIAAVDADDRFEHVPVTREESAVAFCSGAFVAGRQSAAVMGTSGFMASIYAITKIGYTYGIGFPILMNLRGSVGDSASHHIANGMYTKPIFEAMDLPYSVIDSVEQIDRVPDLVQHARLMKRPVAVCFGKDVLM